MTIAQAGEKFNLTPDTLRYYERIGLIPPVTRNSSGIRDYTDKDLRWIEFIKCMKSSGMPLEVLIEYTKLSLDGSHTIAARKELLIAQRNLLAERVEEMQAALARLDGKINGYEERVLSRERELIGG